MIVSQVSLTCLEAPRVPGRRGSQVYAADMRIAITGSTGMIGTALSAALTEDGHEIVRLVRHTHPDEAAGERQWSPFGDTDPKPSEGCDVVALTDVCTRWTPPPLPPTGRCADARQSAAAAAAVSRIIGPGVTE